MQSITYQRKKYMLTRYALLLLTFSIAAQKDSIERMSILSRPEPDLITQVARMQAATRMQRPQVMPHVMTEDDQLSSDLVFACTCCAGIAGQILAECAIPDAWDFHPLHPANDLRLAPSISGTLCSVAVKHVLEQPAVARKINHMYKTLLGKAD